MASLEPSESGMVRFYPKVPPKQQSGYPGKMWSKEQQNSSVLCSPPKGKIHTGEYFNLLRKRLNSNLLQLEAKGKREALKHCQPWYYLTTLIQEPASHLPINSSSNRRKPKYSLPFLHPLLVTCIHLFLPGYSTSFRKEDAILAPWKGPERVYVQSPPFLYISQCIADGVSHCPWLYKAWPFFPNA